MQFSLLPISLLLSFTCAQSSSSGSTSACAAQPVLEACLASTQAIAAGCTSTDYNCLCQKTGDVLRCFDQCPNDPRQAGTLSNYEVYCADASVYQSATTAISRPVSSDPPTTTGASATEGSGSQTTGDAGAVKTASETSPTASSETGKNAANRERMVGTGGVLVGLGSGLAAVFGMLL